MEVYEGTAAPLDQDPADMICQTTHPPSQMWCQWTGPGIIHWNRCHLSQSVWWRSHVTYTFYFSTFLKQTLKIAKNLVLKLRLHPHQENKPYLHPVIVFLHCVSSFFLFLIQMNGSFWCHALNDRYRRLRATHLAPPFLVILAVIATRHSRDQNWPISGRMYSLGSLRTSAEVLWKSARYFWNLFLQLVWPPSGVGALYTRIVCIEQETAL